MRVARAFLWIAALLAIIRALAYLVYAIELLPSPREVGDLESKLVHLAWRFQAGARFYPPWEHDPYVTNFFSPLYFVIIGGVGKCMGADLHQLFVIGRSLTVSCALFTTLFIACLVRRADGPWAGIAAGASSLGAAPMIGAALMVRPDTMAELLGVTGFFVAIGRQPLSRAFGITLLVAAVFTKQTALIFLIAAASLLAVSGRRRDLMILLGGGLGAIALIVAGVTAIEPMFASSLLGEANTPWDLDTWTGLAIQLAIEAPDIYLIPAIGLWIWLSDQPRQASLIILYFFLIAAGLITAAKIGSGLNYFLSLRVLEAMALGALWRVSRVPLTRSSRTVLAASMVAALSLIPGVMLSWRTAVSALNDARFAASSEGRQFFRAQQPFFRLAEDDRIRLFTDSGLLQLHQKERAPFVDPFQFRHLVNSATIRPTKLIADLNAETYDLLITTSDLNRPDYDSLTNGLPRVVAQAARAHYKPSARRMGLFIYVPATARLGSRRTPIPTLGPELP